MLRLISATPSPYARKVRIALVEKNIPFELITEVPWNQGAITEQHNPLAKVPVLILEDGSSIFDSRFILDYLEWVYLIAEQLHLVQYRYFEGLQRCVELV